MAHGLLRRMLFCFGCSSCSKRLPVPGISTIIRLSLRLVPFAASGILAFLEPGTAVAQTAPRKIVIAAGTQVINSSYPYLMMPLALGYWKEEGLDVEVVAAGGSAQAIQQLIGKNADFVEVNSSSLIQAVSQTGVPLRAVDVNTTLDWSLVSLKVGPIRSLADFKGRSIGISTLGSGGLPLLKAYLRAAGIDPEKDVSIQPVGFGGMALDALKAGRVDGLMFWASAIVSFESAGASLNYFRAPEWSTYADFSLGTLAGTLSSDRAMAEAVVRGMAKAALFTATNPDCARKMFWKSFPAMKASGNMDEAAKANFDLKQIESGADSMKEARKLGGGKFWATAPVSGYAGMEKFMIDNQVINKEVPAASLVPSDPAFFERANAFDEEKIRQEALSCAGT
jgi:NitT/TauT family transport system substrate-binding protein